MLQYFLDGYKQRRKVSIVNVGGSRSGKTFDTAYMLIYLADRYKIETRKNKKGQFDNVLSAYRSWR